MFKDNDNYKEVFTSKVHNVTFYAPSETGQYHLSRYVAAGAQNIYSAMGANKELVSKFYDKILDICNNEKSKDTIRTDVGTLINNLKYRLQYPVDEDCALRMGAIYCIMDGENPDEVNPLHTEKKLLLAKGDNNKGIQGDPELYSFFITMGVIYTPAWKLLEENIKPDYFLKRKEQLNGLMLPNL
jgi:hypothetical protein